jgi:hypothetical protein
MTSSQPLVTPPPRRAPTSCESRVELAAIAAIAADIDRRNRTVLNPRHHATGRAQREPSGVYPTEALRLAPRDFADARVSFASCRARAVDLEPHPSLLTGAPLQPLDTPASGIRAAPLEDRAYTLCTPRAME